MSKTTTIDHTSVLEMALVGYEMQRNRIEAVMREIQAELGQGGTRHSAATATTTDEPKPTHRKKRFSAAARKRMAAAQKKRWAALKARKAPAKRTQPTAPPKRQKATVAAPARKLPVQVKAAKKVGRNVVKATPKPKAKKKAPKPKNTAANAPKATVKMPAAPVEAALDPAPATE